MYFFDITLCKHKCLYKFLLVEFHNNLHRFLFDALARRDGKFLAFFSCLGITILTLGCAITRVHVVLYVLVVRLYELNDLVLNRPLEKVELSDRGFHTFGLIIWDLNTLPSAEWIKTFFAVCLQLEFVVVVYFETTGFSITILEFIYCEVLLCVVCDKPVHDAERNLGFAVDYGNRFGEIFAVFIKSH
jgi:hypothetical protein